MPSESRSLRSLIGGPWAVSWQGYVLGWPLSVVFFLFAMPSNPDAIALVNESVVGGTVAYAATGAVLWLASKTVLRTRRTAPVSVVLVTLIGGIAWMGRSVIVIAFLSEEADFSGPAPAYRLALGFAQGAVIVVVTAWVLSTVSEFHEQRRRLLTALVQEEMAADRLAIDIDSMRGQLLEEVRLKVRASAQTLAAPGDDKAPSMPDMNALADASQRISKDLARDLWLRARRTSRLDPLTLIRSTVRSRPFAYWGLLPAVAFGLLVLPTYWPAPAAVYVVLVVACYALVVSFLANIAIPRLSEQWALVGYAAAVMLLLAGTAALTQAAVTQLEPIPASGRAVVWVAALDIGFLHPLIGIAAHVGPAQRDILTRLRRSISSAEIRQEALSREQAQMYRDLAVVLHGGLQADLTAASMKARSAFEAGDSAGAHEALHDARHLLEHAIRDPRTSSADVGATVEAVVLAWSGLVDVTSEVRVARALQPHIVRVVEDVVLEGIGNAVRHAGARKVAIHVSEDGDAVHVRITDDGSGVTSPGPGLGSAMLDDVAPNAWSLEPALSGGSTLSVAIRLP